MKRLPEAEMDGLGFHPASHLENNQERQCHVTTTQPGYSSLTGILMERDHMKDLRRYLALKYIQYLVLSSCTAASTALGLLGSFYTLLTLQSAKVSSKSTAVLISSLAKADLLVLVSLALQVAVWGSGTGAVPAAALAQNLLLANAHVSCALLSCVALEAYLITFLPTQSRHLRTVRNARGTARLLWTLVAAECALLQMDDVLSASGTPAPTQGPLALLLALPSMAAALLRSLSYSLGILLRIFNVYIYYKIFFSVSNRSRIKSR
ncbi:C-X-C chemokine receptor type 5-like isoform X1 [Willisornis vidua]|uniref:C-X-C chemokine receptor type 5-like isoform X1 n=1 Tax=Willisornis vidua TaxID=1566151 RepID=A0ABQ9DKA6_9PASS|nr:C-X-C chemokine receptor type 5-like isoform X1 [Willisornis vidua]